MGLQAFIRFFLPKEEHFYDFLERQASLANEAAQVALAFAEGKLAIAAAAEQVEAQETAGDGVVTEMEEALAKTFVTPIDREDLHHLSAQLDDVLDLTYETVRACNLFGLETLTPPMQKLVAVLAECTALIADAVPKLRKHAYGDIVSDARHLRGREKAAGSIYRTGISALFDDAAEERPARELVREKSVLDDLERAIDHCDTVANTLTTLAVKHG